MKVLEGHRAHLAHLQFHAYGGDDWGTMRSEAAEIAEDFNAHTNLTCDAGAVLFGNAVTITADGPWQHLLYQLTGRKWGNLDVENETGCGIVPYVYKEQNLVNAVQWAVGLELLLLIDDPWRVFLTTDHPNGGGFWRYPEIMQLLMDAEFRKEQVQEAAGRRRRSASCCRTSTASTRSPRSPSSRRRARRARSGLTQKGHLGVGADADVTIYQREAGRDGVCSPTRATSSRAARSSSRRARCATSIEGREFVVQPAVRRRRSRTSSARCSSRYYTMSFENYPVRDRTRLRAARTVPATADPCRPASSHDDHAHAQRTSRRVPLEAEMLSPGRARARSTHDAIRALPVYPRQAAAPARRLLRRRGRGERRDRDSRRRRTKVKWIGRGMTRGRIRIVGNAGMHLGAYMKGGTIEVTGQRLRLGRRRDVRRADPRSRQRRRAARRGLPRQPVAA